MTGMIGVSEIVVCYLFISSVAPMMEWTDHHYRTLARLISKHAWLYTEMLAAETIVYQKGNLVSVENFCFLMSEKNNFAFSLFW